MSVCSSAARVISLPLEESLLATGASAVKPGPCTSCASRLSPSAHGID